MAFTEYPDIMTNSSSLSTMLNDTNTYFVFGFLGVTIVLTFMTIIFMRLIEKSSLSEALTASTFVGTLLTILLFVIGIIPDWFLYLMIVGTVVSAGAVYFNNKTS